MSWIECEGKKKKEKEKKKEKNFAWKRLPTMLKKNSKLECYTASTVKRMSFLIPQYDKLS